MARVPERIAKRTSGPKKPEGGCDNYQPVRATSPWRCGGCRLWTANLSSNTNSVPLGHNEKPCDGRSSYKTTITKADGTGVTIERTAEGCLIKAAGEA